MTRPSKHEYYIGIAEAVAKRSTCLRRQYGAVIVKDDRIISTGYNGSARGLENCCDKGVCWREEHDIPHGQQYEKCQAVHAEANAIINANPTDMIGATLYLAGFEHGREMSFPEPCEMCYRLIVNAQISEVATRCGINFKIRDIDSIGENVRKGLEEGFESGRAKAESEEDELAYNAKEFCDTLNRVVATPYPFLKHKISGVLLKATWELKKLEELSK